MLSLKFSKVGYTMSHSDVDSNSESQTESLSESDSELQNNSPEILKQVIDNNSNMANQNSEMDNPKNPKILTQVLSNNSEIGNQNSPKILTKVQSKNENKSEQNLTFLSQKKHNDEPPLKKQKIITNSDLKNLRCRCKSTFAALNKNINQTMDLLENTSKLVASTKINYKMQQKRANKLQQKNKSLQKHIIKNHSNLLLFFEK